MNGMDFFKESEMRFLLVAAVLALTLQVPVQAGVRKAKPQTVKVQSPCKNGKCPLKK